MRKLWVLGLVCSMVSCDFFTSKEKKTQEMINQEMRNIDWNAVDNYPLFENCDESLPKEGQRKCFEREVLAHFRATLQKFQFVMEDNVDTTVHVDFVIDQEGHLTVLDIEKDQAIDVQMPEFDAIIRQSLLNLPPVAPALKRGIPVRTRFRIPIQLNTR